jgi:hypothetical protein
VVITVRVAEREGYLYDTSASDADSIFRKNAGTQTFVAAATGAYTGGYTSVSGSGWINIYANRALDLAYQNTSEYEVVSMWAYFVSTGTYVNMPFFNLDTTVNGYPTKQSVAANQWVKVYFDLSVFAHKGAFVDAYYANAAVAITANFNQAGTNGDFGTLNEIRIGDIRLEKAQDTVERTGNTVNLTVDDTASDYTVKVLDGTGAEISGWTFVKNGAHSYEIALPDSGEYTVVVTHIYDIFAKGTTTSRGAHTPVRVDKAYAV